MTPELIAILAVGATLAGLMVAIWRDARAHTNQGVAELRAEIRDHRAETRASIQTLREQFRADMQNLREEVRADLQNIREEVRADLAALRKDLQALTERVSRIEGVIEGLFTRRSGRDRHNDAA